MLNEFCVRPRPAHRKSKAMCAGGGMAEIRRGMIGGEGGDCQWYIMEQCDRDETWEMMARSRRRLA